MQLSEIYGRRSHSDEPLPTRWLPVDIVCDDGAGEPFLVRTKLVRGEDSAAVCLSEAISHRIFSCVGVMTAEAFAVNVTRDLALGLTSQYGYDPPVVAGLHWGTRLINEASPVKVVESHHGRLRNVGELFLIYLVDVLLAYRDRQTEGNVLLIPSPGGQKFDLLPIDQSDCFASPSIFRTALWGQRDKSIAQAFDGMEPLVLQGGRRLIDSARDRLLAARECILDAVTVPPDEWYGRAGVEPAAVRAFLTYRLDNLDDLARLGHWRGMAEFAMGGGHALIL